MEVMVVVILLAVLAGTLVPNLWGTLAGTKVQAASERISAMLDYAYHAASATGRTHALIFDSEGRRFDLAVETPPEEGAAPGAPPRLEVLSLPGLLGEPLPAGLTLASVSVFEEELAQDEEERVRIFFFPDGTCEFAALTIADEGGEERVISLNGLSGTIEVTNPALAHSTEGEESEENGEGEGEG